MSAPIEAGFFSYDVPRNRSIGKLRPVAVVGLNGDGEDVWRDDSPSRDRIASAVLRCHSRTLAQSVLVPPESKDAGIGRMPAEPLVRILALDSLNISEDQPISRGICFFD